MPCSPMTGMTQPGCWLPALVGAAEMTDAALPGELAAVRAEIEALRAENTRLRGLLGLTDEREADTRAAWEPAFFAEPTATADPARGALISFLGRSRAWVRPLPAATWPSAGGRWP